jgi:hypothetical protein
MIRYTVAVGNPWDGITLYGSFDDSGEAITYADKYFRKDEWVVVELHPAYV